MANAIVRANGESHRSDNIDLDVYVVRVGREYLVVLDVGGVTIELTRDDLKKIAEVQQR